ncbi:PaaI family thioesterase [Rugosimonospora acidiphila]|uniref:PaaI family thioesterase n=1 Tax=Rugosimonospora acidiphila TaxID=556531 RepID=A0ABP9RQ16_9ACTN
MAAPLPMSRRELLALMPYATALGIVLDEATPGLTRGWVDWAPNRCTVDSAMHGGVLMSLADSVGAVCAYLNVPVGAGTSTVESKTNFFRALREGRLHAAARPLHVGRSFVVIQTDLADDHGRPVGQTTQTQAVIAPKAPPADAPRA